VGARPRTWALLRLADTVAVVALLAAVGMAAVRLSGGGLPGAPAPSSFVVTAIAAAAACAAIGYLAWNVHPAHLLVAALVLSMFTGRWTDWLGIPGALSPQRLLLVAAIASVIVQSPTIAGRPPLRMNRVHLALLLASCYVIVSAFAAGTLSDRTEVFRAAEGFGLLPFAAFVVAPVAFREARHRAMLLAALVGMGFYLGLTAVLETTGPKSLVFPSYILDESLGIHFGRARGPFLEAVYNGFGLYLGGIASAGAIVLWRSVPARVFAAIAAVLCLAGLLFTLQRSVWLGTVIATLVAGLARPEVRRALVPMLAAGAIVVACALSALPAGKFEERATDPDSVWARKNLNRAALNVFETQPLLGVGWGKFVRLTESGSFFEQADTYPVVGVGNAIHNQFLSNAVELGLVGASLWLLAMFLALSRSLRAPEPPPDMWLWKTALLAFAVFFIVVSNFIPTHLFPNLLFWLLAGVASAGAAGSFKRRPRVPIS
jgi:O-antigen ligase